MSDCDKVKNLLVLYAEEALPSDESAQVRSHLVECAGCREELAKIATIRSWLSDPEVFLRDSDAWQFLPRSLAARAKAVAQAKGYLPIHWGPLGWATSVAALFILGFCLIWMLPRQVSIPPLPVARGNEAFLRQMQSVYAREATAQYLSQCKDLLLNVVRAEKSCLGEKYDFSVEVARARELLQRKRMLDAELRSPEVARAKELCDELENFLVNLSTSESCETFDKLNTMERFIEKEQLLLRINLVKSELS